MVYQVANKERMLAAVSGNVTDGFTANITAGAAFSVPAAAAPTIAAGGVGSAVSGATGVSPGSWISIYGANLSTTTRTLASSDLVNSTLPTSLDGVKAQINGKAAYVQYVSPAQINVLAPADSSAGTVAVSVTNSVGTSNSVSTNMQAILPGLFAVSSYVLAVRYPDNVLINGTGADVTGFTTSAAVGPGDIVSLYGSGFGPTNSPLGDGVVFTGAYPTTNQVTVSIGGVAANVLWAGLVGAGLYQMNVVVPANLSDGDQAVIASVAGLSSQSTALIKVAASAKLAAWTNITGLLARLLTANDAKQGIELAHLVLGHRRT
jgi:uncharacterized protein (TIGR03437 family)